MQPEEKLVRIWDAPVRLFHWLLVLLFCFMFFTGKSGSEWLTWHVRAGYVVFALVIFRVLWGFSGSTHARFASFLAGPKACIECLQHLMKRSPLPYAGHNPLGGWMVLVLLLSLAFQVSTGLFSNDDLLFEGPLASLVSKAMSDRLTGWHVWNFNLLLVLAGLHILAVLYHWLFMKENLIGAMFTGMKRMPAGPAGSIGARFTSSWLALVLLAVAALTVYLVIKRPF
jgi:cytochrome b